MEMDGDEPATARRRDRLQELLQNGIPGLVVNGDTANRLAGNLHVSVPDVPNTVVVARTRDTVAVATGSACSSGVEAPSYVLQALGLPKEVIRGALRLGIGKFTTDTEIESAAEVLVREVGRVRALMEAS
jgi:cysteine desulfurase